MKGKNIRTTLRGWGKAGTAASLLLLMGLALQGQSIKGVNAPEKKPCAGNMNSQGLVCMEQRRYDEAKICFSRAVQAAPDNKYYYNNLAAACINLGDYAEAGEHLKKALALDHRYSKALSNMAVSCFYLYRFDEAYRYYRLARRADPEYAKVRFEKHRVIRKLESMNSRNPGNPELESLLDYLKTAEDMPGH